MSLLYIQINVNSSLYLYCCYNLFILTNRGLNNNALYTEIAGFKRRQRLKPREYCADFGNYATAISVV